MNPTVNLCRAAFVALVVALLMPSLVRAQEDELRDVVDQQMSWYMLFGNHRLTDDLGLHTEYQFRRTGLGADWQQSLLRLGLDWHRDDQYVVTGGYGWIRSFPYGEQPIGETFDEHRIWQQLITKSVTGSFKWMHRYRLEQRYMDRPSGASWQHRARYFVQITWPVPNPPRVVAVRLRRGVCGASCVDQPRAEPAPAKPPVRGVEPQTRQRHRPAIGLPATSALERRRPCGAQPHLACRRPAQLGFQDRRGLTEAARLT